MATTFTVKFGQMFVINRMLLLVLNAPPSFDENAGPFLLTEFFYNDKGKLEPGFARELTDAKKADLAQELSMVEVASMNDGIALLQKNRRKLHAAARRLVTKVGPSGNNKFLTEYLSKSAGDSQLDIPTEQTDGPKVYVLKIDAQRVSLGEHDGPSLVSVDRAVLAKNKYDILKCVTGANKKLIAGILKNQLDANNGSGASDLMHRWHKYINATRDLKLKA